MAPRSGFWALVGVLAAGLSACLDGSGGGPSHAELHGTWTWTNSGCRQSLSLDDGGQFTFAMTTEQDGVRIQEVIDGDFELERESSDLYSIRFVPGSALDAAAMPYCSQWVRRDDASLDSAELESALGTTPAGLAWHEEISDSFGKVLIAAAPDGTDQFALYQDSGALKALRFDDYGGYDFPLYRQLPEEMTRNTALYFPVLAIEVPDAFYAHSFALSSGQTGDIIEKLILNVLAASDVEVTVSGTGVPNCRVEAYVDSTFVTPLDPQVLDPSALGQTLRVNPLDGAVPLEEQSLLIDGQSRTVKLLALGIRALAEGTCTVDVRARPTAVKVLEALASSNSFDPSFSINIPESANHAVVHPTGYEQLSRQVRLIEPLFSRGLSGLPDRWIHTPRLASGDSTGDADLDVLGLMESSPKRRRLSIGKSGGHSWMNLYDPDGRSGLGPFTRWLDVTSAEQITVPSSLSRTLHADGQSAVFRFQLDSRRRISLWSGGTADTHAVLFDSAGLAIAEDEHGAPDGNGFQIVRTLSAGSYDLHVTASGGGQLSLHAELAGEPPVADEALFACLNTNHADPEQLDSLTELYCLGVGISSLAGLEAANQLEVLDLGSNGVQDLSPLADLTSLRVLDLAGNRVSDLGPIRELPGLLVLNLAGNPLDAEELYSLKPLAGHLRELDIHGVSGLSEGQLKKVRKNLPRTLLIGPDGSTIP